MQNPEQAQSKSKREYTNIIITHEVTALSHPVKQNKTQEKKNDPYHLTDL